MQYSYNIIVDSPCEITADFAKANQLKVLHFTYTEGNGDEGLCGVDDLFVSRTAHEFYEAMRNGAAPQTSQPSQHEFESAFREASSRAFQQSILHLIQVFRAATKVLAWRSIV